MLGLFDDNVPVTPGITLDIRATPVDDEGHPTGSLTENWSVSGGGTLEHAVTSATGGNDPTLNRWTTGSTSNVQAVTVTLPAYPSVSGTIHVVPSIFSLSGLPRRLRRTSPSHGAKPSR